ncbi:hypothetical protein KC343_g8253 [Hortaea werneckii]|nr:hypothetical protein KC352_g15621 [Hortaea werneckii]KAI7562333.1 hypothetical protein KC317_g8477 [Hortaea werneckii]KAI7617110.1 hypothetical protein KC346_g5658 [Hortaea werneckii]KAI7620809.1 hypothetical protein KC343_g8253 [Hortaea werneckii]KAI7662431.1 hypothetical protein KC319_g8107 [Hortaea werneckii]
MYNAQYLALASLAATFAAAQYSAEYSSISLSTPDIRTTSFTTPEPFFTLINEYDRTITSACPTSSALNYTLSGVIFSSSDIRTLDGNRCAYEGTQTVTIGSTSTPGPNLTTSSGPNELPTLTTTVDAEQIPPASLPSAYGDIPPASARITTVTPPFGGPPNTYTLVDCQALSAAPGRNISAYRYTAPGGQVAYAPQIFNDGAGSCAVVPTPTYSYTGTGPIQSTVAVLTTGANGSMTGSPTSTPEAYVGAASRSKMMTTEGMLGLGGAVVFAAAVML